MLNIESSNSVYGNKDDFLILFLNYQKNCGALPTQKNAPVIPVATFVNTPSSADSVVIQREKDNTAIINNFIKNLVSNSIELDSKVYDFVNENFWDLL